MAGKESTFSNMVITLLVISAVASFALGGVYKMTKEPIEKAKKEKLNKALKEVLPEFDNLQEYKIKPDKGNDSLTFYKATKGDVEVGTAVKTYTDEAFSGRFWIIVGLLPDGTINKTAILEQKETPGLGDKIDPAKSDFSLQFNNKNPESFKLKVKKDGGDVDAITAATISSRAFCDAIQKASDTYKKDGGKE